jgi:predicted DNA-binding protein (MmcQ/YjbR family)
VRPAPYLARAKWVQLANLRVLEREELAARVRQSHALVAATLPKRLRPA